MSQVERRFLRRLRDSAEEGILLSSVPKSCHRILDSLEHCFAAKKRFVNRARRVLIANPIAFQRFLESRFPLGVDAPLNDVFDRAGAVIAFGDAKAVDKGAEEGIFVRSANENIEIRSIDGEVTVPVGRLSIDAGGAALSLTHSREWSFAGTVVVVENAEPFWRYESVLPRIDLAIYASGNMSGRLIDWVSSPHMAECQITHWGDYDPRGVAEYIRLFDQCQNRVTSFVPHDIESLMIHGKRNLLIKQKRILEKVRGRQDNDHVGKMIDLFDRHKKGLEQEVLLPRELSSGNQPNS